MSKFLVRTGIPLKLTRYYVLREDMMSYLVNDIAERLSKGEEAHGWEVGVHPSYQTAFFVDTYVL